MLKKISFRQNKRYKKCTFFSYVPTDQSFIFNLRFLYELKHKVHLSKCMKDFPFPIPSRFIKVYIFI